MKGISIISLVGVITMAIVSSAPVPTAIFHGLGDSCYYPGMWEFTDEIAS